MTTPSRKRNVSLAAAEESAATTERALGAEATAAAASVSGELLADERYLRLQCETERMKKKTKKKKLCEANTRAVITAELAAQMGDIEHLRLEERS
jgi:hypothetical protein